MNNLMHALIIARKDIKIFVTDRLALLFFILFPFMFIVLFNFVLGSTNIQDKRMELHLVTREANGMSHQIISTLETKDESQLKPGQPVILWDKDYDQALEDVESKKIAGFIVFPEDFTE
ncbi:MAG: hypothetical protein NTV30_01225, partial [Chloroflexi bacterium]|nr:hypothetical protein [Chloroflexota bacterium]